LFSSLGFLFVESQILLLILQAFIEAAGDGGDAGDGDEGQEKPVAKNYLYVPDTIKQPRMHYFIIPKLGSYMAMPLFYN
jgi:hypothetical protein